MDKQLLDALGNLSLALEELSRSLKSKSSESAVGTALQSGNFSETLERISKDISNIKSDTKSIKKTQFEIIKNQSSILNILEGITSVSNPIDTVVTSKGIDKIITTGESINNTPSDEEPSGKKDQKDKLSSPNIIIDFGKSESNKGPTDIQIKIITGDVIIQTSSDVIVSGSKNPVDNPKSTDVEKRVVSGDIIIESSKNITINKQTIDEKITSSDTIRESAREQNSKSNQIESKKAEKKVVSGETIKESAKEEKSKSFFGSLSEDKNKIKDGVATIILIASGVLAIGLAFKLIGSVDVASVLSISVALPLIAIAFKKVHEMGIKSSDIGNLILVVSGISTAIMASSYILSMIRPIGAFQALTALLISGVFTTMSLGFSQIFNSIKGISKSLAITGSIILPLLMVGLSAAIAGSSYFLSQVKPIGLFQSITAVMISGTFVALSYGISNIISSMKGISLTQALVSSAVIPLVFVALSWAISKSSHFLSEVKPIGLFQSITSILIAGVFTTIGYGINRMIGAFKGVSLGSAILASASIPILLIAISWAISKSSHFLSEVKPIGLFQAITSILISGVFLVLSYGVGKMLQGFSGINPATAAIAAVSIPLILVALSASIKYSSEFLSGVKPIGLFQFLTSIAIAGVFVVLGYAVKPLMQGMKGVSSVELLKGLVSIIALTGSIVVASHLISEVNVLSISQLASFVGTAISLSLAGIIMGGTLKIINKMGSKKDFMNGSISLLLVVGSLVASSILLSKGDYTNSPSPEWALQTSLSLSIFGFGAWVVSKIGIKSISVGALSIAIIALSIAATSHIMSLGDYTKYPSKEWITGTTISLGIFAVGAGAIGAIIVSTGGLGAGALALGLLAISGIAYTIVSTDSILSSGKYGKYPSTDWIIGVGKSLGIFALEAGLIGAVMITGIGAAALYLGLSSINKISSSIVSTDRILSLGSFTKFPDISWISGTSLALEKYSRMIFSMGSKDALGGLTSKLTFGAFKDPLTAGIAAVNLVSQSIVDSSNILSKGKYSSGPTKEWADGIKTSILAFSPIYKMIVSSGILKIFGVGNLSDSFTSAIESISIGIVTAAKIFSDNKSSFISGPKKDWADGIAISLGAFSPIYDMLFRNGILKIFGGGVGPDEYTSAIQTVSGGIITAANELGKSSGIWKGGPSEQWAKGIGISIGAFSPVYEILLKNSGWFKSGISADIFAEAIKTVSRGIVTAAEYFSSSKVAFDGGPKEDWAKGVGAAIGAFASVFDVISSSNGLFNQGRISGDDLSSAIKSIAISITESSSIFSKGVFDKGVPTKQWSEGVSGSIQAFSKVFDFISDNNGWFGSDISDLTDSIVSISKSIVSVSHILSVGKYDVSLNSSWIVGIKNSISSFMDLLSSVSKIKESIIISGLKSVILVTSSIKSISDKFGSITLTTNIPDSKWVSSLRSSIEVSSKMIVDIGNMVRSEVIEKGLLSIHLVINTISKISDRFSNIVYSSNIPTSDWIKSISDTLVVFGGIINSGSSYVSDSLTRGKTNIYFILDTISDIGSKMSKIVYGDYPESKWMDGVENTIKMFGNLIKYSNDNFEIKDTLTGGIKINRILSIINDISSKFNTMVFNEYPSEDWRSSSYKTISGFGSLVKSINGSIDISEIKDGSFKIVELSKLVSSISNVISKSEYKKSPSEEWSNSVGSLISNFSNSIKVLSISDFTKGVDNFKKLPDIILSVSEKLATGLSKSTINKKWIEGSVSTVSKMLDITTMLGSINSMSIGNSGYVSNIDRISDSFRKLSSSVDTFTNSLDNIDSDKISQISGLKSGSVLINLVNDDQFNQLITQIESRSQMFDEAVKKMRSNQGPVVRTESTSVATTTIDKTKENENEILSNIYSVLSDIQGVIGRGKTLDIYLKESKDGIGITKR